MRVPAVVYSSARLLEDIRRDQTLAQACNVACLPGIQGR
jgi:RNA-splicing ligase RtcB